jgi:hypothetical protein
MIGMEYNMGNTPGINCPGATIFWPIAGKLNDLLPNILHRSIEKRKCHD